MKHGSEATKADDAKTLFRRHSDNTSAERRLIVQCAAPLLLLVIVMSPGCAAFRPNDSPDSLWRMGWTGFRSVDVASDEMGLSMQGGYQPGKIPVVFVHGLLSNHMTWNDVIADLSFDSGFQRHYQVWTYTYPTGPSYLTSATDLRERLAATRLQVDPHLLDTALDQMVLVGHSMGGLVSKLQITYSDNRLWAAISDQPFDAVNLPKEDKQELAEHIFFEPSPRIKRVVFIATPHAGSRWTERPLGKLSRHLVEFPDDMRADFQRFVPDNAQLLRKVPKRIPTSVDHLCPTCPEILATRSLRFADGVELHSIIGTGYRLPDLSKGDGVVSIESARIDDASSELLVKSSHTKIHRDERSIAELERILIQHVSDLRRTETSLDSLGNQIRARSGNGVILNGN